VQVDKTSTVTGVSIVHGGESAPFQSLPVCDPKLSEQLTEYDQNLELLKHTDLNFDGLEEMNMEAYPESKTPSTHEDWFGGPGQDPTYRWNEGKLELIEQRQPARRLEPRER
jgi:hypothetical protein